MISVFINSVSHSPLVLFSVTNENFANNSSFNDSDEDSLLQNELSLAHDSQATDNHLINVSSATNKKSWEKSSRYAPYETEKEFEIFKLWLLAGSGRCKQYLSTIYNLPNSRINQISARNNWDQRAQDYDREQLQIILATEQDERAKRHKEKLEEYRVQQEFIGRTLSADAAKIAAMVSRTLDKFMENDRDLDIRDLPVLLNAANKAAEVGRNLQSSSLGVDQLLTALEEFDE